MTDKKTEEVVRKVLNEFCKKTCETRESCSADVCEEDCYPKDILTLLKAKDDEMSKLQAHIGKFGVDDFEQAQFDRITISKLQAEVKNQDDEIERLKEVVKRQCVISGHSQVEAGLQRAENTELKAELQDFEHLWSVSNLKKVVSENIKLKEENNVYMRKISELNIYVEKLLVEINIYKKKHEQLKYKYKILVDAVESIIEEAEKAGSFKRTVAYLKKIL